MILVLGTDMFSKVYLSTQLIKYTFKLIAQLADFNNGVSCWFNWLFIYTFILAAI